MSEHHQTTYWHCIFSDLTNILSGLFIIVEASSTSIQHMYSSLVDSLSPRERRHFCSTARPYHSWNVIGYQVLYGVSDNRLWSSATIIEVKGKVVFDRVSPFILFQFLTDFEDFRRNRYYFRCNFIKNYSRRRGPTFLYVLRPPDNKSAMFI